MMSRPLRGRSASPRPGGGRRERPRATISAPRIPKADASGSIARAYGAARRRGRNGLCMACSGERSTAESALDAPPPADNMSPRALTATLSEFKLQSGRAILNVRHLTTYRYKRPVEFGDHRMMMRPRDGHDQRLLASELEIEPEPRRLRWLYDTFDNCVAVASFSGSWTSLRVENRFTVERIEDDQPGGEIDPRAQFFPFSYAAEELPDIARAMERLLQRSCRGHRPLGAPVPDAGGDHPDQSSLDDDDLRDQGRVLLRARARRRESRRRCKPWSGAAAPAATSRS